MLGADPGKGCEAGQGAECKSEGRACSKSSGKACKWPGEQRVCTRGTGVRGARRCAVRGVAGPRKGAGRALCRACVCKRGAAVRSARVCRRAECAEAGVRGPGRGRCVRPRAGRVSGGSRGAAGCVLTRPGGGAAAPARARRSWLAAPVRPPAARTPRRPPATRPLQCRSAPASEERGAGRGLGGAGAAGRAAPQSGHAPRSPPRAPSRSPAPLPLGL